MKRTSLTILIVAVMASALLFAACSSTPSEETAEIPNPIHEYASVEELDTALGFDMLVPPAFELGETVAYSSIDDTIGQAIVSVDGWNLTLRKGPGSEDISGVYGAEETKTEDIGGIFVKFGAYEGLQVATWTSGNYSYSAVGEGAGMTEAIFESAVQQIVPLTAA